MSRYELTKDLETGNSIIDMEHRELLQAVNKLLDACGEGNGRVHMNETIKFLNDYVDRHFSHEEQLQRQSNYPGFTPHRAFHEKYKQTLREITSGISVWSLDCGAGEAERAYQYSYYAYPNRG